MQTEEQKPGGMIITDDFAENPVLDFNAYADTIVEIIKRSNPNFTIGIYGEWGTGKTTLMRKIESELKSDKSITTVWFNAWRYEREEQFTLIPLLKKIAYTLPDADEFNGLRESIKKGVGTIRRNIGQIITSVVSDFVGKSVGSNTEKVVKDISNQLIPKIELLTEVNEKDTIYFDGLDKIEEEVRKIRVKGKPVKIIVFIDDLDRCSPKKALEVFESVKVFLGIEGFIYLLGLSYETISKLITAEYGKSEIKGDQYIKKIIQIPISLPEWSTRDVSILIEDFINSGFIVGKYVDIIKENKDLIAKAIENNPREAKRFINNFIVAHEILLRYVEKVDAKEFLLVQAINVRWNRFFRLIVKLDEQSRNEVKLYVEMPEVERNKELDTDSSEKKLEINLKRLLRDFKIDSELWNFLRENSESIFGIKNWEIYRRGAESVREIPSEPELSISDRLHRLSTETLKTVLILDNVPYDVDMRMLEDLKIIIANLNLKIDNDSSGSREEVQNLVQSLAESLESLKDDLQARSERFGKTGKVEKEIKSIFDKIDELLNECWGLTKM